MNEPLRPFVPCLCPIGNSIVNIVRKKCAAFAGRVFYWGESSQEADSSPAKAGFGMTNDGEGER